MSVFKAEKPFQTVLAAVLNIPVPVQKLTVHRYPWAPLHLWTKITFFFTSFSALLKSDSQFLTDGSSVTELCFRLLIAAS